MKTLLVFLLTFGLYNSKVLAESGSHGGDGRSLTDIVVPESVVVGTNDLKEILVKYLVRLRANSDRLKNSVPFAPLLEQSFINDVRNSPPYKIAKKRGGCGYSTKEESSATGNAPGFPRVASTDKAPTAVVCLDMQTANDLKFGTSKVLGILAHEHCRHLPDCQDENLYLARTVAQTAAEILNPGEDFLGTNNFELTGDLLGSCSVVELGLFNRPFKLPGIRGWYVDLSKSKTSSMNFSIRDLLAGAKYQIGSPNRLLRADWTSQSKNEIQLMLVVDGVKTTQRISIAGANSDIPINETAKLFGRNPGLVIESTAAYYLAPARARFTIKGGTFSNGRIFCSTDSFANQLDHELSEEIYGD
jgi:hypothetical protein